MFPDHSPLDHRKGLLAKRWVSGWIALCGLGLVLGFMAGARSSAPPALPTPSTQDLTDLDRRVRAMDQDQLYELQRQRDAFYALPQDRQQKMRELHQAIESHPQRDQLRSTLKKFYAWYRNLSVTEQPKIADEVDLTRRMILVQEIRRRQAQENSFLPFPRQDLEAAEIWVKEFAKRKEPELRERLEKVMRESPRTGFASSRDGAGATQLRDLEAEVILRRLVFASFRPGRDNSLQEIFSDQDLDELFGRFTPEGRRHVPTTRSERIRTFVGVMMRPYLSDEDLQKFYVNDLSAEHREYLDRMPPELLNRQLRAWYFEKNYIGRTPQLPNRRFPDRLP